MRRTHATIDFGQARGLLDLPALIRQHCAEGPHGRFRCPFHAGHGSTLTVTRDGLRWACWSCGARGGPLDFLAALTGQTAAQAARAVLGAPDQARPAPTAA
jgi:hypothetical protein